MTQKLRRTLLKKVNTEWREKKIKFAVWCYRTLKSAGAKRDDVPKFCWCQAPLAAILTQALNLLLDMPCRFFKALNEACWTPFQFDALYFKPALALCSPGFLDLPSGLLWHKGRGKNELPLIFPAFYCTLHS